MTGGGETVGENQEVVLEEKKHTKKRFDFQEGGFQGWWYLFSELVQLLFSAGPSFSFYRVSAGF